MTFIYYLKRKHTIDMHKDKVYAVGAAHKKPNKKNIYIYIYIYKVRLFPLRKLLIVKQMTQRAMD